MSTIKFKIGSRSVSAEELSRKHARLDVMNPSVASDGSMKCEIYIGPEPNEKLTVARNAISQFTRCRFQGPVSELDFEECNGPVFWYTVRDGGGLARYGIANPFRISDLNLHEIEEFIYVFSCDIPMLQVQGIFEKMKN